MNDKNQKTKQNFKKYTQEKWNRLPQVQYWNGSLKISILNPVLQQKTYKLRFQKYKNKILRDHGDRYRHSNTTHIPPSYLKTHAVELRSAEVSFGCLAHPQPRVTSKRRCSHTNPRQPHTPVLSMPHGTRWR